MKQTKSLPNIPVILRAASFFAVAALAIHTAHAHPYASSITNNGAGIMSFYLNESGGNVTIKYDDGSTNANYDGITTGTNLLLGAHTFSLAGHTNYTISVFKSGVGVPTLITNFNQGGFTNLLGNVRGVDVNRRPGSPYFGLVYMAESRIPTLAQNTAGIWAFNPDLSTNSAIGQTAGVNWGNNGNGTGFAPYRLSVSDDDYLMVGIAATNNSGVFRIPPTLDTNQLVLGPIAYGVVSNSYGSTWSHPLLTHDPRTGLTLWRIDCDLPVPYNAPNGGYNCLLVDTNINPAVPRQTAPDIVGPNLEFPTLPAQLLFNEYPGLQIPGNGLIYCSISRDNFAAPCVTIYTNDPANGYPLVWTSQYGATSDYFNTTQGGFTRGVIDIAVSPDLKYLAALTINNWFVIAPLTNGLPDVANIFYSTPTTYTGNGRGTAFDAADNLYLSSSGLGYMESWTLGVTTTAVTTGNTNGSTGFSLTLPATTASVVATQPFASQGGVNGVPGAPIPGVFTISRTNALGDYSAPVTLLFTLGGTATNGVYTVSPAGLSPTNLVNVVILPPGVLSTNITITPTTNNVPRRQTTVVLSLQGGASYTAAQPVSDTVYIQNTSTNQLVLTPAAPSMYNAHSNDFCSALVTRLGDTNVPAYNVTNFNYSGTAVAGTDFAAVPTMTFNPGDITNTAFIFPLSNGVPPIHTTNAVYVGNKTVLVTLGSGSAFSTNGSGSNSTIMTIIDNADPPGGVLRFSDTLTSAADAANWGINYGSSYLPADAANYDVEFGYDLTTDPTMNNGIIPLPPGGATNALRITCNKHNLTQTYPGGVSVYYTNQAFNGNFAVRFNMNVIEGFSANNVEGVMFGINHNGVETNWWEQTGLNPTTNTFAADGVFYWIQTPPGGSGGLASADYIEFTGLGSVATNTGHIMEATINPTTTALRNIFKHSVFTAPGAITGGTPANNSSVSASPMDTNWSDVEIKQVQNLVTLSIDKTVIFSYNNTDATTSLSTNGYLMLGYDCPYGGVLGSYLDTPDAAAYFANLRVVELSPEIVSQPVSLIVTQGANVSFTATATYGTAPITNVWYLGNTSPVVALQTNSANATTFTDSLLLNNVQSGTNYFAVFSDAAGSVTSLVAQLEVIIGPANVSANAGATAKFSVSASGQSAPTAFRWMTNGVPLTNSTHYAGVTTGTLTITNVQQADALTYSVAVTNAAGSVKPSAMLTVNPEPPTNVVVTPASQTRLWGSNASFTVSASGTQPFTYQWKKNGTDLSNGGNVSGATNSTLTLSSLTQADAASYSAGVTNSVGGTNSSNAGVLTIFVPQPKFTATALVGTNVVLSFTSTNAFDTTNAFYLLSSPVVTGPYTTNSAASFTLSNGVFHVTAPQGGNTEFYRLQHVN